MKPAAAAASIERKTMPDVMKLAEELGKAINDSPQAVALRKIRDELSKQPEITKLLKDYRGQTEKIARLEAEQKPVEVDDKRRLQELHGKLVATDIFKKYTAAQVEYVDVMRRVNDSLRKQLADTESE